MNPPPLIWKARNRRLDAAERTRIMGVLNTTPDSFSDGGRFLDPGPAVARGLDMLAQGADILDIGGESTRPGAGAVSVEEEIRRVVPVVEALRRRAPDALLSVDTSKAAVAEAALAAGADILNDVTAGLGDPDMLALAARTGAGLVLMHMRGTPRTMQRNPEYADVVAEVRDHLAERVRAAEAAGVARERLVLDPGVGFGKRLEHNLALIAGLGELAALGRPLLLGVSRKRWLGDLTGRGVGDRMAASLAGAAAGVERGAHIIRVHDVIESCDMVRVIDSIRKTP